MKIFIFYFFLFLQIGSLYGQNDFSFVFLPDTHLRPDSTIEARFDSVAAKINTINPDFVIMGGDMIYTAKNVDNFKAEALFDYMDYNFSKLNVPIKYALGNHEIVGVIAESGLDPSHPMWGKNMYSERYGESYYSFDFKGWKFIVLDGILISTQRRNYSEGVDSIQLDWLKNELSLTDTLTPICIAIHTPLINPKSILYPGSFSVISEGSMKVLSLLTNHNLRLVLQGHNHVYMKLEIGGVMYISGGSTSNSRPVQYYNDGFTFIKISNDKVNTEFIHTENKEIESLMDAD